MTHQNKVVEVPENDTVVPAKAYVLITYNAVYMCNANALKTFQEQGINAALQAHRGEIAYVKQTFSSEENDLTEHGQRWYLRDVAAVHDAFLALVKQAYIRNILTTDKRQPIEFGFLREVSYDEYRILQGVARELQHEYTTSKFAFGISE